MPPPTMYVTTCPNCISSNQQHDDDDEEDRGDRKKDKLKRSIISDCMCHLQQQQHFTCLGTMQADQQAEFGILHLVNFFPHFYLLHV